MTKKKDTEISKTGKDLLKQLLSADKDQYTDTLMNSVLLDKNDLTSTDIPALNIALQGDVLGGYDSGVIQIAGKSKHFKTLFALYMASAFMHKHEDAIMVFFDSEFGSPRTYFHMFSEHAKQRIIHKPVLTIEDLKTKISNLMKDVTRDQKVIFVLDSLGNLASEKETQDAMDGKSTVDMTRAKAAKSLFRIATPQLKMKDIPFFVINHTYQTLEMFSKEVTSGGTGAIYNSDTIFMIGKQQEKEGKDLLGWNFIININKSRFVKEGQKIGILVTYDGGISKYSGIWDLAVEFGIIDSPSKGYYTYGKAEEGEELPKQRRKAMETDELMQTIVDNEQFQQLVQHKFLL